MDLVLRSEGFEGSESEAVMAMVNVYNRTCTIITTSAASKLNQNIH